MKMHMSTRAADKVCWSSGERRDNAALMPDATVTTMRYRWGSSVEALGGPFDLALASDLTYEPAAHGAPVVYKLVAAAPHGVYTAKEASLR